MLFPRIQFWSARSALTTTALADGPNSWIADTHAAQCVWPRCAAARRRFVVPGAVASPSSHQAYPSPTSRTTPTSSLSLPSLMPQSTRPSSSASPATAATWFHYPSPKSAHSASRGSSDVASCLVASRRGWRWWPCLSSNLWGLLWIWMVWGSREARVRGGLLVRWEEEVRAPHGPACARWSWWHVCCSSSWASCCTTCPASPNVSLSSPAAEAGRGGCTDCRGPLLDSSTSPASS